MCVGVCSSATLSISMIYWHKYNYDRTIGSVALNADSAARVQENYRLVYGPTTIGATTRTARHLTENSSTDGDYHNDEVQWEGLWIRLFTAELTLF